MKEQIQILIDTFIPNKRKKDYYNYSQANGFNFQSRASLDRQNYGIHEFKIIKSNYWNEMTGIISKDILEPTCQLRIYDYTSTDNMRQHVTTVFEVRSKILDLDKFYISPRSKIMKLKSLLIDPTNNFHDNYSIDSNNIDFTLDDLGDESLDLINSFDKIYVEGEGEYLLVYIKFKKIKISDIKQYDHFVIDLLDLILSGKVKNDFV